MPLCGFNQKMLDGLLAFNEGLVEHGLIERAKLKSGSLDDTLQHELADMDRFLSETSALNDQNIRRIVEGLTTYAQGVYQIMKSQDITKYQLFARRLSSYLARMDTKFYSDLEGKPDDMKQLVSYLNNQII